MNIDPSTASISKGAHHGSPDNCPQARGGGAEASAACYLNIISDPTSVDCAGRATMCCQVLFLRKSWFVRQLALVGGEKGERI